MTAVLTPIHEDRRCKPTLEVCPCPAERPKIPPALCYCGFQISLEPSVSASSITSTPNSLKQSSHPIPIR